MTTPSTSAQGPVLDEHALEAALNTLGMPDLETYRRIVHTAIRAYVETAPATTCCKGLAPSWECRCERDRLTASQPSGVRVKPLEWDDATSVLIGPDIYFSRSTTPFGPYRTEQRIAGRWWMTGPDGEALRDDTGAIANFATLDEAKAAVQADYEARILNALATDATPAPTSGSEDGGEAAPFNTSEAHMFDPAEDEPATMRVSARVRSVRSAPSPVAASGAEYVDGAMRDTGRVLVRQLRAVMRFLNGQAYSSTLSCLNAFEAALAASAQEPQRGKFNG